MRKPSYWIRSYFGFSKNETKGTILLMIIMFFLLFIPFVFKTVYQPKLKTNSKSQKKKLDSLVALIEEGIPKKKYKNEQDHYKSYPKKYNRKDYKDKKYNVQLSPFDPNNTSIEGWKKLGVREYLAKRINKYISKGGRFKAKEDLLKIYGFPEIVYQKLEPYIEIQKIEEQNQDKKEEVTKRKYKKRPKLVPFNINTADTTQLKKIKGIGSYYAKRIIKFRNLLGGFVSQNQFKEVFGIKPEIVKELEKYAQIDLNSIKKIPINTASLKILKAHPYIKHNLAVKILNYRNKYGKFKNSLDLSNLKLIKDDEIQKLAPYLSF